MAIRYRLVQWLSEWWPAPVAYWLSDRVADMQWRRATAARLAVRWNLQLITGEARPDTARERRVFRNFGRYLVEVFGARRNHPALAVEGEAHLQAAAAQGRGVIAMTAHLGNWELAGALLRRRGYPVTAVALPHEDPATNRLFDRQRTREGLTTIPLGPGAWKQSLKALKRGDVLGVLGDRDYTDHGIRLPLFSGTARFPEGPALLSVRSGAPIVPTFLVREGPGRFRLCFEPALQARSVEQILRAFARVLESYLRNYPDQWLMFQPVAEISS